MNIRWFPHVIPDSMLSAAKRVMSRPTLTGSELNAEEADPARGVAGRPRKDGGAKAEFGSSAATSALRAVVMTTAVAAMAVATAVVDGNAA